MGSNNSKEGKEYSQDGLRSFAKNFEFLKSEKDPRFGRDVMIYSERSSKKLIGVFNKATEDEILAEGLHKELKMRLSMDHKNLAKIVGFTKSQDETLCGSSHQVSIYNEYYESDLDLEIKDRTPQKEYFQESEVWYVANSLISLGSYFQSFGIYHGDIRPLNVLMDDNGSVNIIDHGIINPHTNNLSKSFAGDFSVYLSPREMEILKTKSETAEYDVYKADVFSAGLTLLYMCHLENPINLYNYDGHSINYEGLNSSIADVEKNYSKPLADLIGWMTIADEAQRPDFNSLQTTMATQGRAITSPTNPLTQPSAPANNNYGTPAKNQRGLNTPSNIHFEKSPITGTSGKKDNSLMNSQLSSANGNIQPSPVLMNNSVSPQPGVISYGLPQNNNSSPFNSAIGAGQNPNVKMGTVYSYPAHYYK